MWEKLFPAVNNVGVAVKYRRTAPGVIDMTRTSASYGICAGMSAVWLKNMFTTDKESERGNMGMAPALYAKWYPRWNSISNPEIWNRSLLENAGLRTASANPWSATDAIRQMKNNIGSYYISTGNHAMASVTSMGVFYFFDPNEGAKRTTSLTDFDNVKTFIEEYSRPPYTGYDPTWLVLKVENN